MHEMVISLRIEKHSVNSCAINKVSQLGLFNREPLLNFLTLLGSPAKPSSPFCIAKGDSFFKASSLDDPMTRNLGQVFEERVFVF